MINRERIAELLNRQSGATNVEERFAARGIDYEDVLGGLIDNGVSPELATSVMIGIEIGYVCALDVLNKQEGALRD